jgi:uncharacterized protein YndB with AHSA1/START domain
VKNDDARPDLARFIDRWTIEYVRVYPHPIERVWRAITDPKEFRAWFIRGEIELRQGGSYRFESENWTGPVLAIDPPRFIKFGNRNEPAGYFQYELCEAEGGTRMRFVQHFPSDGAYTENPDDLGGDLPVPGTPWAPGFVGGWHEFWDALRDHLDGVPVGSRLPATEFEALAAAWAQNGVRGGLFDAKGAARLVRQFRRTERWNELNKIYREFIRANCPHDV